MNNNRYRSAMQDEKFDEKKLNELCELLKNYDFAQSAEQTAKKPRKNIRLSVILAAALAIAAIGCTTVAADTGLFKYTKYEVDVPPSEKMPIVNATDIILDADPIIKIDETDSAAAARIESFGFNSYFDEIKEQHEISDDVPMADDPYTYAKEVCINAVFVNSSDKKNSVKTTPKIIPQIVAIIGDGMDAFFDIAVDATALELPDDIPEDALFGFRRNTAMWNDSAKDNLEPQLKRIPLQEDGIYRYTHYQRYMNAARHYQNYQLYLYDFGYSTGDEFIVLQEGKFTLTVEPDMFNTIESYTKTSGPKEVRGVMLEVSLTPISMEVTGSASRMEELKYTYSKTWLSQGANPWAFEYYMRDGTVIGSEENYFDTAFRGLFGSIHGWVDFDNDISHDRFGFSVPIDVDEVVAISVHGVRFDFETAQDAE